MNNDLTMDLNIEILEQRVELIAAAGGCTTSTCSCCSNISAIEAVEALVG